MGGRKSAPGQSLKLRISHIREEGEPYLVELAERELRDLLADTGAYATAGQGLEARLHLARYAEIVSVQGELETLVAYACSRCLADATERLKLALHWRFLPAKAYREHTTPDEEVELTSEDMDVSFYDGDEIDLGELIREALLLELAPHPVCAEGCREELAAGADAEVAAIDPRWLPLLELKRRQRS